MLSNDQVSEIIIKGISKYSQHLRIPLIDTQIMFGLNESGEVVYTVCELEDKRLSVKLKDLIGMNLYNMLVSAHISKLLKKFAAQHTVQKDQVNILAGIDKENEVYFFLRSGSKHIRQITDPKELKN